MRMFWVGLSMAFFSLTLLVAQSVISLPVEGVEIWERALAARGGRQFLQGISNFVVTKRQPRQQNPAYVDLYILPDRYWSWWNDGGVLGTTLWVNNGSGTWKAYADRSGRGVTWFPPTETDKREQQAQALFLMETRWFRPKVLGLTVERLGREEFDVITVDAGRDRVKYYIDRKTSLVRRVSPEGRYGNVVSIAEDMMDYRRVGGIMMPSRMSSPDGDTFDLEFGFNVDYDPGIFQRKPALEDGPEGWKPAKK